MKKALKQTIMLIAGSLIITQTLTLCASQAQQLKPATPQQLQIQARLMQAASSSSSASNGNAHAIYSPTVITPASPQNLNPYSQKSPDSQESPNSDTQYIGRAYPTKNQQAFAKMLYNRLNQFPVELINLVVAYHNFDLYPEMQCVQVLAGHKELINALLPMTDTQFASASDDHTIKLWEIKNTTWTCTAILEKHKHGVTALARLNEDWLISGSSNGTILLWYLVDNKPQHALNAFSKINALVALSDESFTDESFASASNGATMQSPIIVIWEKVYKQKKLPYWHAKQTFHVATSPRFLITFNAGNCQHIACGFNFGDVEIYRNDEQSWSLLHSIHVTNEPPSFLAALQPCPTSENFMACYEQQVSAWDPKTLSPVYKLKTPTEGREISACTFCPNSYMAIASCVYNGGRIFLFKNPEGSDDQTIVDTSGLAHGAPISNLISMGHQLISSAGDELKVWEQKSEQKIRS
jgi:WD40 repeat protein